MQNSPVPKSIERIRSTGALGTFPGAALASVEHDVYILKVDADAVVTTAKAELASRLEDISSRFVSSLVADDKTAFERLLDGLGAMESGQTKELPAEYIRGLIEDVAKTIEDVNVLVAALRTRKPG